MPIPAPLARLSLHARRLALLAAAACATSVHAVDDPADVGRFFSAPHMTGASLSPDGKTVAMAMAGPDTGRIRLVAMDVDTRKLTLLASYADTDVRSFHWINDHRLVFDLLDLQEPVGEHRYAPGLYAVNIDGSVLRQLVNRQWDAWVQVGGEKPLLPWWTHYLRAVGDGSDDVYVTTAQEADETHVDYLKLQRLETVHGRLKEIATPVHSFEWVFDSHGALRVATTLKDNHMTVLARDPATDQWSELGDFARFYGDNAFHPRFMDADGTLYVTANGGADTSAVWRYDLERHKMADKPYLVSPRYDLDPGFLLAHDKLAGLRYQVDAEVTQWIAPDMQALQDRIDKLLPSTVNRLSVAAHGDGRFVVINASSDHLPGLYFLYGVADGKLLTLGNARPDIDPKKMADMEPVHYAARDGLEIPAWLSVPRGAERKNLPLVLLVHGGPWVRGRVWGWDPEVQFLASRGYAVLEPEFRGSTGYGQKLFTAGWKQWGLAMQDDLADGVKWAVAQGLADPRRVCIAGASYGGYAVLMGLVRDPQLYRCGIDWVGVTDIDLMFTSRWSDLSDAWKKYGMTRLIGDPATDAARFKATSPIENAARIHAPVLLAYGAKDKRVPLEHGENFHDALMKQPGAKVEWVVYQDEGHGWYYRDDTVDFWNRVAKFLDANIGTH
jgi:dipeptidyl aminopeptidase/acylaminoacyl peptidase